MASKSLLVCGLAYGDEGKGATVDYLVRRHQAGLVVRYNGGSQAAHNVVTSDDRHHTFSQFGAGTFVPGCRTYLSQYMLVSPFSMQNEAQHLQSLGIGDAFKRLWVHGNALVVTPYHRAVNRLLEWSRGPLAHGSCGVGIGATREFHLQHGTKALFVQDTLTLGVCIAKLYEIQRLCWERIGDIEIPDDLPEAVEELKLLFGNDSIGRFAAWYLSWAGQVNIAESSTFDALARETDCVVFEGAQGVLLDEIHGTAPHNSWTDTTFGNAYKILDETNIPFVTRIGCLRTYYTRHGAGSFPTEDPELKVPELHNNASGFQGAFRLGRFYTPGARYALGAIGGVDEIALNHVDVVSQVSDGASPMAFIQRLESDLDTPVNIVGTGPKAGDRAALKYVHSIDSHRRNSDLRSRLPRRAQWTTGV